MEKRRMYPNEYQAIQRWWEEKVVFERSPIEIFNRMMEEVKELEESIKQYNGTPEKAIEAGLEIADVFIIGFSLASSIGVDIERMIEEKLEINFRKYNPEKAKQLYEAGLSREEVLKVLKERWKMGIK